MSETYHTLADMTLINNEAVANFGISNIYQRANVLNALNAIPATGFNTHQYRVITGEASANFRPLFTGLDRSPMTFTSAVEPLQFLDTEHEAIDVAYLRGVKDPDQEIKNEIASTIRTGMYKVEVQMFGLAANRDANGFNGLAARYNSLSNSYVLNAQGSAANGCSSVYLIRTGDNTGVAAVLGGGQSITVGETYSTRVLDGTGKAYTGVITPGGAWMGIQVGAPWSVVRIVNLDATHKLTDTLLYQALALFPEDQQPNIIAMNKFQLENLRASRTAVNSVGTPAPRPVDADGIRIITTGAIPQNEPVVS